jgi:acyl carrier protein
MERPEIIEHIRQTIADSCGIDEAEIEPSATLFNDLGITSIDLVDILFGLESIFGVELKVSDIEARSRSELGGIPFEVNGVITREGLEVLRRSLPQLPPEKLVPGLTMYDITNLITVDILCTMVHLKLNEQRV